MFLTLAADDVRAARDVLAPAHPGQRGSPGGWVSLEVNPRLAYDAETPRWTRRCDAATPVHRPPQPRAGTQCGTCWARTCG